MAERAAKKVSKSERLQSLSFLHALSQARDEDELDAVLDRFWIIEKKMAGALIAVVVLLLAIAGFGTYFAFRDQVASIAAEFARPIAEEEATKVAVEVAKDRAGQTVDQVFGTAQDNARLVAAATAKQVATETATSVAKESVPNIVRDMSTTIAKQEVQKWADTAITAELATMKDNAKLAVNSLEELNSKWKAAEPEKQLLSLRESLESTQGAVLFLSECTLGDWNEKGLSGRELQSILNKDMFEPFFLPGSRYVFAQSATTFQEYLLKKK